VYRVWKIVYRHTENVSRSQQHTSTRVLGVRSFIGFRSFIGYFVSFPCRRNGTTVDELRYAPTFRFFVAATGVCMCVGPFTRNLPKFIYLFSVRYITEIRSRHVAVLLFCIGAIGPPDGVKEETPYGPDEVWSLSNARCPDTRRTSFESVGVPPVAVFSLPFSTNAYHQDNRQRIRFSLSHGSSR